MPRAAIAVCSPRAARSGAQALDILDDQACCIRFVKAVEKAGVGSATPDREARDGFVILRITIGEHRSGESVGPECRAQAIVFPERSTWQQMELRDRLSAQGLDGAVLQGLR